MGCSKMWFTVMLSITINGKKFKQYMVPLQLYTVCWFLTFFMTM